VRKKESEEHKEIDNDDATSGRKLLLLQKEIDEKRQLVV